MSPRDDVWGVHREALARRARRALLWGLGVYIVLHVGLAAVAELNPRLRDPLVGDRLELLEERLHQARREARPLVVMVGSSRVGDGFDAGHIEQCSAGHTSGRVTAFNLGFPGAGPMMGLLVMRRLVEADIRPDLVLVEVLPLLLTDPGNGPLPEARHFSGLRLREDEMALFERYGVRTTQVRSQRWDVRLNPWGTLRFQLLRYVAPALVPAGEAHTFNRRQDRCGRVLTFDQKHITPEAYRRNLEKLRASYTGVLGDIRLGGPPVQALRDLLAFCRAHGLPTVLVRMPESSDFRHLYSSRSLERLDRLCAELRRDLGTPVIDASPWVPDEGNFVDGHHLMPSGAVVLSERLFREVVSPALEERSYARQLPGQER